MTISGKPLSGPTTSQIRISLATQRLSYALSQLPEDQKGMLREMPDEELLQAFDGAVSATLDEIREAREQCGIPYLAPIPATPHLDRITSVTLSFNRTSLVFSEREACFDRETLGLLIAELQALRDLMPAPPKKEDPSCAASPAP